MSHVYVLLFHDVWDSDRLDADDIGTADPNPNGEPETVTVEGVFTTQAAADAAYADAELTGWDYFTVEQHEVTPPLTPLATAHREIEESQDVAGVLAALTKFEKTNSP